MSRRQTPNREQIDTFGPAYGGALSVNPEGGKYTKPLTSKMIKTMGSSDERYTQEVFPERLTNYPLDVIMSTMIKGAVESIIDVIYPPLCIYCKKPYQREQNVHLCNECYYTIKRHIPPFCRSCGRGLEEIRSIHSGICTQCSNKKYSFDRGWSLCS